jgi:hypothetical protein
LKYSAFFPAALRAASAQNPIFYDNSAMLLRRSSSHRALRLPITNALRAIGTEKDIFQIFFAARNHMDFFLHFSRELPSRTLRSVGGSL